MEQTTTHVSAASRITSSSNSFQPRTDSSTRTSWTGESVRPRLTIDSKSSALKAMPPPVPPSVKEGRTTTGKPNGCAISRASSRPRAMPGPQDVDADLLHRLLEEEAVLPELDGVGRGAEHLDAVRARTPASSRATARLSAVCPPTVGRRASGRSFAMTRSTVSRVERLDVRRVGELRVRHDRGGVRVDEDDPVALAPEDPAGLRPGVVELAGLADDDRPGAEDEDRLQVGSLRHARSLREARALRWRAGGARDRVSRDEDERTKKEISANERDHFERSRRGSESPWRWSRGRLPPCLPRRKLPLPPPRRRRPRTRRPTRRRRRRSTSTRPTRRTSPPPRASGTSSPRSS